MRNSDTTTQRLNKIVDFVTSELRPACDWSIKDEYPQVFQERNIHNIKYIEKDGLPVTHAALKPIILKTPQILYKIGAIGSVVTNPSYRGQGLSSKVILECLNEAENQDCDIAILWTSLHDFYRRLGFESAGFEEYFTIDRTLPTESNGLRFVNSSQVDPEAILKLFNRHTIASLRSAEDIKKFLVIPNTQVYTAWDSQHSLKSYAIMGKGADLEGFIHEWGGCVSDLVALLNFILTSRRKPFTLLVGAQSINLITYLQKNRMSGQQGFLGMLKILNLPKFSKKIEKLALQMGFSKFSINRLENEKFLISLDRHQYLIPNESSLVQVIFGPNSENLAVPEDQKKFNQLFPLPLWIWGWDSI